MSAPVVETAFELAPVAGAMAGYIVGVGAEYIAGGRAESAHLALSETLGQVATAQYAESSVDALKRRMVGPLVWVGIVAGVANGLAWSQDAAQKSPRPAIQVVVDKSGATAYTGEPTVSDSVNKVLDSFSHRNSQSARAIVARIDEATPASIEVAKNLRPRGDAPMRVAYDQAMDNIQSDELSGDSTKPSSAVVVITNGNSFGKPTKATERAQQSDTPVYVINVAENTQGREENNFRLIAKRTGGEYLTTEKALKANLDEKIADKLSPRQSKPESNFGLPIKLFVGLTSVIGFGVLARSRKYFPATFKGTKVKDKI